MADQWTSIALRNDKKMLRVSRNSIKELTRNIIRRTPIDTRAFIENWNASIGAPDRTIGKTLTGVIPVANSLKAGEKFYFTNPRPYYLALEYGHSSQAPQGMVRISVAEWTGIVERQTRKALKSR